jgi:glutamate-5-semialdehyde dehydrogenase
MSEVLEAARRARTAAAGLAPLERQAKDAALLAMATALEGAVDDVLAANARDVDAGREAGTSASLLDRLTLTPARVTAMADGLRHVATLPDPVGEVVRGSSLPNGLELRQVRVPLGVVGIVYEARPNVTADAAGLCVKSGNAVLLRGSGSAYRSNTALVEVLARAATAAGLPEHSVQLVPGQDRDSVKELMRARGLVDVLIPRGRGVAHRGRRHRVAGAGHRDRRRQLHRLRGRRRRPRHGAGDHRRRQDHPAVGVQRRRDAARARRRRRAVPAAGGRGAARRRPARR